MIDDLQQLNMSKAIFFSFFYIKILAKFYKKKKNQILSNLHLNLFFPKISQFLC
jgi:hypothetical protein